MTPLDRTPSSERCGCGRDDGYHVPACSLGTPGNTPPAIDGRECTIYTPWSTDEAEAIIANGWGRYLTADEIRESDIRIAMEHYAFS